MNEYIRSWLKTQNLSLTWLALQAGVHKNYLGAILNGRRKAGLATLARLETAMGLPQGTLVLMRMKERTDA